MLDAGVLENVAEHICLSVLLLSSRLKYLQNWWISYFTDTPAQPLAVYCAALFWLWTDWLVPESVNHEIWKASYIHSWDVSEDWFHHVGLFSGKLLLPPLSFCCHPLGTATTCCHADFLLFYAAYKKKQQHKIRDSCTWKDRFRVSPLAKLCCWGWMSHTAWRLLQGGKCWNPKRNWWNPPSPASRINITPGTRIIFLSA